MKLIGGILLGIFAIVWLVNVLRMLLFNLSRFSERKRLALPGYINRFVTVQIFNFGLVVLLAWGSFSLLSSSVSRRTTSEEPILEQTRQANTVKADLSEYIAAMTKAWERCKYFERIEKMSDFAAVSDPEMVDVYDDLLVEMKRISPKTSEVLEVHEDYIRLLEDYVATILEEGHMSATFKYAAKHQEVIDQLNTLSEEYGLEVGFK